MPRYKDFQTPETLAAAASLPKQERIELLREWELDLRERSVAAEEGMTGPRSDPGLLARVRRALDSLDASDDGESGPTKLGT